MRDAHDYARRIDYIHYKPAKQGFVASPMAWLYSSFRKHVAAGIYPADWGQKGMAFEGVGQE